MQSLLAQDKRIWSSIKFMSRLMESQPTQAYGHQQQHSPEVGQFNPLFCNTCTQRSMKVINILRRSVAQSNRTSQIASRLTGPMTLVHNAPQNVNHFHAPPSTQGKQKFACSRSMFVTRLVLSCPVEAMFVYSTRAPEDAFAVNSKPCRVLVLYPDVLDRKSVV